MRISVSALLLLFSAFHIFATDACQRGFLAPDQTITALGIDAAVYGDFDEDGRVDIAFTHSYRLVVSLNRGGGVFEPSYTDSTDIFRSLGGVVDLDRDGHLDILSGDNPTGFFRGRGDGAFEPLRRFTIPNRMFDRTRVLDFDHDGYIDLVDFTAQDARFYHSNGDGTFTLTRGVTIKPDVYSQQARTTVGDFDGDGHVDFVRIAYHALYRSWTLSAFWSAATTESQESPLVNLPFVPGGEYQPVDLDEDGAEELFCMVDGRPAAMRFSNGQPSFEVLPFPGNADHQPMYPVMADVNGDGRRDLLFSLDSAVGIALRRPGRTFAEPVFYGFPGAGRVGVADVNGDGIDDVVARHGDEGLPVIYGESAIGVALPSQQVFPAEFTVAWTQIADMNGDSQPDIVASDGRAAVAVLINDGAGSFRSATTRFGSSALEGSGMVVADFNGDGRRDVALVASQANGPIVGFGNGAGGFARAAVDLPGTTLRGALRTPEAPGAALLVTQNGNVNAVRIANGQTALQMLFTGTTGSVVAVDIDGDGFDEVASLAGGQIEIRQRNGAAWDVVQRLPWDAFEFEEIVRADFNEDFVDDLLVKSSDEAFIYLRNGTGYVRDRRIASIYSLDDVGFADVDHDSHADLIVASRHSGLAGLLQVLRKNDVGAFVPYNTILTTRPFGRNMAVGDIDGDGAVDVVRPAHAGVELDRNTCVTNRIRVASPPRVKAGERAKLVIHALSTDGFLIGLVTIRENGRVVAQHQPDRAYEYATFIWTTEPLADGVHVFTIEYEDQFAGMSTTTVAIQAGEIPKRRSVRK